MGRVKWIGIRPARRQTIEVLEQVQANTQNGLIGDRYAGSSGKRQVTLIQWEHLSAIASMLSIEAVDPALLRRNIAISRINLLALKDKQFSLGSAVLEYTGLCHPCSFMETTLGPGGYNAVRGHGGLTARVIDSGLIRVNDRLSFNSSL
ncbi:MAG: MOSC domain-containing protein YiiM [Arenicella sp.]